MGGMGVAMGVATGVAIGVAISDGTIGLDGEAGEGMAHDGGFGSAA